MLLRGGELLKVSFFTSQRFDPAGNLSNGILEISAGLIMQAFLDAMQVQYRVLVNRIKNSGIEFFDEVKLRIEFIDRA